MSPIGILVVDPHLIMAESLSMSLDQCPQFVARPCAPYSSVPAHIAQFHPRVVILNIYQHLLVGGLEACHSAAETPSDHTVVLLAPHALVEGDTFILDAVEKGADGVFSREEVSFQKLVSILEDVENGCKLLDPGQLRQALLTRQKAPVLPDVLPIVEKLTPRERDIANFISSGRSTSDMAKDLFISERTVQTHISNILAKLGVNSRAEAAIELYKWRVLSKKVEQMYT